MKRHYLALFTLLLGALVAPLISSAAGDTPINSYTVTYLGSLGGLATEAEAINDAGQVVGTSRNGSSYYRAFRWENGEMADLGTLPGGAHSGATAINNQGQVVGWTHADTADYRAFLWDPAGGMRELGHLGGSSTMPLGINDAGQVTGWSRLANGQTHAFLWQNGQMFDLSTLPGGTGGIAFAINASGQVAGRAWDDVGRLRAFLWNPSTPNGSTGTMVALSPSSSEAFGINDSGQVVGYFAGPDGWAQPVLWDNVGTHALPLGMPERWEQTAVGGAARAVNSSGSIVGTSVDSEPWFDSEGGEWPVYLNAAVTWDPSNGVRRVSTLTGFPVSEARALNASGQILGSEYLLNPSPLPARPSELGVFPSVEDGRVTLRWRAGSGAASYTVKRAATSGGPYSLLVSGVSGTSYGSYSDTAVKNGNRYYYVVSAVNAYGESANSNETAGAPESVPSPPSGLTAVAGIEEVSLSWAASPGADHYRVYYAETPNGPFELLDYASGSTYMNPGMVAGVTYRFVVTAVNTAGESGFSNEATATPALPLPPPAPTGLAANPGEATVNVSWNPSAATDYFRVKRSTNSGGPYMIVTSIVGSSHLDVGLTSGVRYYYVVTAVNRGGESPVSNEVSATPTGPPLPKPPTRLTATAGKRKVNLKWTQSTSAGVTKNRVYRSTSSGGSYSLRATVSARTSYSETGLTSGVTYYYVVTAVKSPTGKESAHSNQTSAKPR